MPLLALTVLIGCTDAGPNADGALPTLTEPGFYALLSAAGGAEASVVTLSLKQVPGGIQLVSAQGELEFDANVLQLARVALPEGVEGDAEEVSPGRVRFVATLAEGTTEPVLLQLHFRGREKPVTVTREMFGVRFEEVAGGADFADLTSTVRSDQLLFVRSR